MITKKFTAKFALASVLALCASAAQADVIRLANIFTNDCSRIQSEIQLLNAPGVRVTSSCMSGGFWNDGNYYYNQVQTYVEVPYTVYPGTTIQLGNIDTNNCDRARDMIALLDSRNVAIDTFCEAGAFAGHNGQIYRYRLNTTARVN
jgi:hypothetical protein